MSLKNLIRPLTCLIFLSTSSSLLAGSDNEHAWKSEHFRNNPLVGKIWSPSKRTFVPLKSVFADLVKAKFILLGESHPNKDHHLLQARFLAVVAKAAIKPARVVVEMVPESLGKDLRKFRQDNRDETAKLGDVLKWKKRGWGEWENYKPIFDVAYKYGLPILSGNLDRADVRRIGKSGAKEADKQKFALDVVYTKPQIELLNGMLFDSHCKMVPREALAPMKLVQQVRDGFMANQMLAASDGEQAVLIAGAGHTRNDWAVPRILRAKAPKSTIFSIAFIEVTDVDKKPQDYERASADKLPLYDYIYFTPKAEIKDHCAELIKHFKGLKKKKKP